MMKDGVEVVKFFDECFINEDEVKEYSEIKLDLSFGDQKIE